jgi:hypothetical protein
MIVRPSGRDEALDRALFERRARTLPARAGVPSLQAVLAAAGDPPAARSAGRGRAGSGLLLAVACLLGVARVSALDGSHGSIGADVSRALSSTADVGGTCEDRGARSCSMDTAVAAATPAGPARAGDDAPRFTASPHRPLWCDERDNRCEMP